jgi:hypothetical protein
MREFMGAGGLKPIAEYTDDGYKTLTESISGVTEKNFTGGLSGTGVKTKRCEGDGNTSCT